MKSYQHFKNYKQKWKKRKKWLFEYLCRTCILITKGKPHQHLKMLVAGSQHSYLTFPLSSFAFSADSLLLHNPDFLQYKCWRKSAEFPKLQHDSTCQEHNPEPASNFLLLILPQTLAVQEHLHSTRLPAGIGTGCLCGEFSVDFLHVLELLTRQVGEVEILSAGERRVFIPRDFRLFLVFIIPYRTANMQGNITKSPSFFRSFRKKKRKEKRKFRVMSLKAYQYNKIQYYNIQRKS